MKSKDSENNFKYLFVIGAGRDQDPERSERKEGREAVRGKRGNEMGEIGAETGRGVGIGRGDGTRRGGGVGLEIENLRRRRRGMLLRRQILMERLMVK